MIPREELRQAVEAAVQFEFVRSGGPGGQNVNKVNTKAVARLDLAALGLPEAELDMLRDRLSRRLVEGSILPLSVQETRSQVLNRALAIERILDLLERALVPETPRLATKPTRASRKRRLDSKRRAGARKRDRRTGYSNED